MLERENRGGLHQAHGLIAREELKAHEIAAIAGEDSDLITRVVVAAAAADSSGGIGDGQTGQERAFCSLLEEDVDVGGAGTETGTAQHRHGLRQPSRRRQYKHNEDVEQGIPHAREAEQSPPAAEGPKLAASLFLF